MRLSEVRGLVASTGDPAFAINDEGHIVGWNTAAAELFGRSADETIGMRCGDLLQGYDECGKVCSNDCTILQSVQQARPIRNFDIQAATAVGPQWCNVSVMVIGGDDRLERYALYIVRPIDVRKRLEMVVRDFQRAEQPPSSGMPHSSGSVNRAPAASADLSVRELEVLSLLARGRTTAEIGEQLHISRTTVNNHIQHILHKLDAHSRLEAIRKAEHAGLI